ncbi:MAG: dTDP-4-dehydrorhamnose 3,5-epimerase [Spirochaetia bacterium]
MIITQTPIEGLLILQPQLHKDERGYFFESYQQERFIQAGITGSFVQDNESLSSYGTIRGLHFQTGIWAQAKLVRVIQGAVYDVAVDLRPKSPTFGQSFGLELTQENHTMLYIPRGFAHGFATLSDQAVFFYKCDNFYHRESDGGVFYDDPQLKINWPISQEKRLVSQKDLGLPLLQALNF